MSRTTRRLFTLALSPILLAACSESSPTAVSAPVRGPARAFAFAGDGQHVIAGGATTDTLTIFVVGTDGAGVADAAVTWTGDAAGTLVSSSPKTDSRGYASAVFAGGTRSGSARVVARVAGLDPVEFQIVIDPAAASRLQAMAALYDTLANNAAYTGGGVKVTDQYGNAIPSFMFDASVFDAAGEPVQVGVSASDDRGIAAVPFTVMTTTAGDYTLRFSSANLTMAYRITVLAPVDSSASSLRRARP